MGFTGCQDGSVTWDKPPWGLSSASKLERLILRWANPKPRIITKIFSSQPGFGLPLAGGDQNIPVDT